MRRRRRGSGGRGWWGDLALNVLFAGAGLRYSLTMTTLEIARLSPQERLDLIGALWDSLAPEEVALTPAQDDELTRRMATFDADARQATPWEDIEADWKSRG